MAQVWLTTAVVCVLCCLSVLRACKWDPATESDQGLDIGIINDGIPYITDLLEILDTEQCQKACCEREDCHLALIGFPADGHQICHLVNCMKDGKDVCVLTKSTQFQVYRKIQETAEEEHQGEAEVRALNTTDHCHYPFSVGKCRASFPRFYYDITDQTCKVFIYGGCSGNDNNFSSKEEWAVLEDPNSAAQGSRMSSSENIDDVEPKALPEMSSEEFQEKCLASADTGPCRASIKRFYYSNGACQAFTYGGCQGNQNNYDTEQSCMNTCTVKVITKNQTSTDAFEAKCVVPSDSGPCRAAFRKFYFDASTQSCKPFVYGGCKGNLNRYSSEEECMSACSESDGGHEEHGHSKDRRLTPAFLITLAIISALLLVGLMLITIRRRAHLHFTILDDKEELLPAEEQVCYEQLPKQITN
ncbi:hypothetical protein DNTS_024919 [Danionella cerebrum]|uniref:Uncharacterized protein n=1 Tax=Danionella cerebrum TaxID=2873325 RepID=A0A553QIU1_9TELE|nr:hypothetical protein DNTS_024919 [Danionella translucida]